MWETKNDNYRPIKIFLEEAFIMTIYKDKYYFPPPIMSKETHLQRMEQHWDNWHWLSPTLKRLRFTDWKSPWAELMKLSAALIRLTQQQKKKKTRTGSALQSFKSDGHRCSCLFSSLSLHSLYAKWRDAGLRTFYVSMRACRHHGPAGFWVPKASVLLSSTTVRFTSHFHCQK